MSTRTIPVRLPRGAYPVVVGAELLGEARERIRTACPAARYAIIADATVAELYGHKLAIALDAPVYTFPAGEGAKTRATWTDLTDRLIASGLGRDGALVALGGGVTGDLTGFVAATYLRGVRLIQVPTTVLAMVDSAIGGKTAIDTPAGKNLVGAFHQPSLVLADVATLRTLPLAQRRAGLVEAIKHGAIADGAYYAMLEAHHAALLAAEPAVTIDAVTRSVAIKAQVVAADEREAGRRAVLNAGHTVGHALEHATGFALSHGAAVAIGLVLEARLGETLGVTAAGTADRLAATLTLFGLPVRPPTVGADRFSQALLADKKNRAGRVRFAPLAKIGAPYRSGTENWTLEVEREQVSALVR